MNNFYFRYYDTELKCLVYSSEFGTEDPNGKISDYYQFSLFFASLLASSECETFNEINKLLPYCDKIEKLNAVCTNCGSFYGNYSFYKKLKSGHHIVVGDEKEYTVLCKKCYDKLTLDKIKSTL